MSIDKVNFLNAPNIIYELIYPKIDKYCIEELYIIRDVFGKNGIYILTKQNISLQLNDILNLFQEDVEDISIIDYIDEEQIYIERELSSFGRFLKQLYDNNKKANKKSPWLIERHLQFSNWFKENALEKMEHSAKIITGYSYKGGMGRSTLIAMLAIKSALEGKNVVVLDFDFEAPGISNMFIDFEKEKYSEGVLDYIIEKPILKEKLNIKDFCIKVNNKVTLPISEKKINLVGDIRIFPASNMADEYQENYMQKISRINFSSFNKDNDNVLMELINEIDKSIKPDIIFIDSRTGITDIGGISLNSLSDINICIFSNDKQNIEGMKILLHLFYDKESEENKSVIVQSLLRIPPSSAYILRNEQQLFKQNLKSIIGIPEEELEENFGVFKMRYIEEFATDLEFNSIIEVMENNKANQEFFVNSIYRECVKQLINKENIRFNDKVNILNKLVDNKAGSEDTFLKAEDFKKRFVFKDEYSFIFRDDKFIIIGNKGEGKSGIFSLFKQKEIYKAYIEYLKSKNIVYFREKESCIESIFLEGFSRPSSNKIFPGNNELLQVYKKCKSNIDNFQKFWECFTLYQLEQYYNNIFVSNKKDNKINMTFCSMDEIIEKFDNSEVLKTVYEKLNFFEKLLSENDIKLYLIYDYLDVYISKVSQIRGSIISGLISMWQRWDKLYNRIKCKIFLRSDIYDEEVVVNNKTHLDDNKISLVWNYNDLLKIILKYLISEFNEIYEKLDFVIEREDKILGVFITNDEEKIYKAIELLFGNSIHGGFSSTIKWIRNHLCDGNKDITPRTILWMLQLGAYYENSINKYLMKKEVLINGYCIKYALKGNKEIKGDSISRKKLMELREEYPEFYQYIEGLESKIEAGRFPLERKKLIEAFDEIMNEKKELLEENFHRIIAPEELIIKLKEVGVLNIYKEHKGEVLYTIPDLYLYGLGLTRKGS